MDYTKDFITNELIFKLKFIYNKKFEILDGNNNNIHNIDSLRRLQNPKGRMSQDAALCCFPPISV